MTAKKYVVLITFYLVAGSLVTGCGGTDKQSFDLAAIDDMPAEVQSAPVVVQEAYQFAAANADVLEQIPCYCGCGGMGHTSNYACYVAEENPDGDLVFDGHALGCSICVDITRDTMRMLNDGKSIDEIYDYVDFTYSQFGPSNFPKAGE
jgi:hypothetical protein